MKNPLGKERTGIARLPPDASSARNLRVILLYAVILASQAAVFFIVRSALPSGSWKVLAAFLLASGLSDIAILFLGLSLRRRFLGSRDLVARHGAGRIVALLDLLRIETAVLRSVGEGVSPRLAERGMGGEIDEAVGSFREIEGLIAKAKSLMKDKGRQEAFFEHMAGTEARFGELFPRLEAFEKRIIDLVLETLDEFKDSRESLYRYMFFLSETGAILSRMSGESNRYSTDKMEKILAGFKELAAYSAKIGNDSASIMRDIMDASGRSSIGAIARESGAISAELDSFFRELDSLRGFSEEIVSANAKQLANIRRMAEGIEDFSETIRIISMNVNIEAARLSSSSAGADARNSGRGFQVLAKNMSDFAQRAQDLAREERRVIDEAEGALTGVNARFLKRLGDLMSRVPAVRARLDPFAGIIKDSFANLESVVRALGGLSGAVDQRLKAIIGQLQFQDLTRQEVEHIVGFLSAGLSLQGEFAALPFAKGSLSAEEEKGLKERAMRIYRDLATTVNEHRVIGAYSAENGLDLGSGDADGGELADGSIRMF